MIQVVAALIREGRKFMICRRPRHKARGLLWEFVGGKTEHGETGEEALIRECREELDVEVKPLGVFSDVVHDYPDISIRLTLYNAEIVSGTPKLLEHEDIAWITPGEIPQYEFCPADEVLLEKIKTAFMGKCASETCLALREKLFSLRDEEYKSFNSKLVPNISPDTMMGIRVPALRTLAKSLSEKEKEEHLSALPHDYFEENNLHAFIIGNISDFDEALREVKRFLPYVDNWGTCDSLIPKAFTKKKHRGRLFGELCRFIASKDTYTVRFGIITLMRYYLDEDFSPEHLKLVASVRSEEYYVNMAVGWYFATALAKQYEITLPYIAERKLSHVCHKMAVKKALESFRVSDEHKKELKELR